MTTAMRVRNDITEVLDNKQCCLSLFIDFSEVFDTVDHLSLIIKTDSHMVQFFAHYCLLYILVVRHDFKNNLIN